MLRTADLVGDVGRVMKSEHEIWKSAKHVVEQHGEQAGAFAEARAQALLNKGDDDGWMTWTRIGAAILEMQEKQRRG